MKVFIVGSTMLLSLIPTIFTLPTAEPSRPIRVISDINAATNGFQCSLASCDICPDYPGCADVLKNGGETFHRPCPPVCDKHGHCGCKDDLDGRVEERTTEPEGAVRTGTEVEGALGSHSTDSSTNVIEAREAWNTRPCPGGLVCDQHRCICKRDVDDTDANSDMTISPREAFNLHPCPGSLRCNKHSCHCKRSDTEAEADSLVSNHTISAREALNISLCQGGVKCSRHGCHCERDVEAAVDSDMDTSSASNSTIISRSAFNTSLCPGGVKCSKHGCHCTRSTEPESSASTNDTNTNFIQPCPTGTAFCNERGECICRQDLEKRDTDPTENFIPPCPVGTAFCNNRGECICRPDQNPNLSKRSTDPPPHPCPIGSPWICNEHECICKRAASSSADRGSNTTHTCTYTCTPTASDVAGEVDYSQWIMLAGLLLLLVVLVNWMVAITIYMLARSIGVGTKG